MLNGMRLYLLLPTLSMLCATQIAVAQTSQHAFEVASVRPSQHEVGPDYNNQIAYSGDRFTGKNVTLKRLVAESWHCEMSQVTGPPWIDRNEYDVEARMPAGTQHDQIRLMLRTFLSERFHLKEHIGKRLGRIYELKVGKSGAKIQPVGSGTTNADAGSGFHFHGDMRQFADLLAVQFSIPAASDPSTPVRAGGRMIPVVDKTGLEGVYDFNVDQRPELGTDAFTGWKRVLEDQLGLDIVQNGKADILVVTVDGADKVPTAN
ncbi:MAG TPA: TIGR03435 family protein [Terracidiphilus sp.]|nr:TIGR03435 family protein [Terracidiphilus sp.]